MFDYLIGWSLRNRVLVLALYILLGLGAVAAASRMAVDVFPEFAPPQVHIETEALGYPASDVESLVTRPIEAALLGAPSIDQVRSSSTIGLSRITVVFDWGTDIYRARQIVQERLQGISAQLPAGVTAPQLMPATSAVSWLLKFALVDWSANFREHDLRSLVDWDFRNRLLAQSGVASVVAVGGGVKQYQVLMDPLRMRQFGVSTVDIADALQASNGVAPGAFIYPSMDQEYFLRIDAMVQSPADLNSTVVAIRDGRPIRLEEVADVGFGSEIKRGDAQIFGGPAVIGTVSKLWGADTLETTRRVETVLKELAAHLPADVQLIPDVFRQANFIEGSIANLKQALLSASVIVTAVLLLFLFRWQPTVISLVAIPASLLAGVAVLWSLGIGINALTLGGLVFAVGEVVDDAIIDVENILRRLRENHLAAEPRSVLSTVYEGSREVRNSVVFATIVIVVAFMPIFFLEGIEGRIFRPLAVAYLAAIGSSLLVALTLVPVLCYYLIGRDASNSSLQVSSVSKRLLIAYRRSLLKVLDRPWLMAAAFAMPLVAAVLVLAGMGRSFLPTLQEGNIIVATTLMPGTSLQENLRVGTQITQTIAALPDVAGVVQRAGRSRLDEDAQPVNFSEFDVTLKPGTIDPSHVIQQLREALAPIPGMAINVSQFISHRMSEILSGVRAQVVIKVFGQDFSTLQRKQREIYDAMLDVPGIADLQMEPVVLVPGINIKVNREVAAAFGLTPSEVMRQASLAFNGIKISKVLEGDRTFDLYLRGNDLARTNLQTLQGLPIKAPNGVVLPLNTVANVAGIQEPSALHREGGARRAVIQSNVHGRDLNGTVTEVHARIKERVELPPGYSIEFGGDYIGQQRATRNILISSIVALIFMFIILNQAFGSWRLAGLILLNLPLALIGGVFSLALFGETLNVSSLIGLVALFGIATRSSILLVSRYQVLQQDGPGRERREIALQGAQERLLPILMTAATAALAVIPLLIGDPAGKELERPLAIVLLGGVLSSTLLNLFVLPAFVAAEWSGKRTSQSPV